MITAIGIIMIGIGVFLAFKMEGKAFSRRNTAGIEEFGTYGESLRIKAKEGIVKVAAGLITVVGIFMAITYGIFRTFEKMT